MSVLRRRHQTYFTVEYLTVIPVNVILSKCQIMPTRSAPVKISHINVEGFFAHFQMLYAKGKFGMTNNLMT